MNKIQEESNIKMEELKNKNNNLVEDSQKTIKELKNNRNNLEKEILKYKDNIKLLKD